MFKKIVLLILLFPLCGFSAENEAKKKLEDYFLFQLAQTKESQTLFIDAIKIYESFIEKGKPEELAWGSMFRMGEIYNGMGFWDQALHWHLKAFEHSPDRAEPLFKIAQYYRSKGKNHLAYLFAKQGSLIPLPANKSLFISPSLYDYEFDEEISIVAFYTPYQEEGKKACNKLILKKDIPPHVKDQASRNMIHYAPILKGVAIQAISLELPLIREGFHEKYSPTNPSIRKTADGYRLICRTVNYHRFGETGFRTKDPFEQKLKTRNFLLDYDKEFHLLSQKEIVENFPRLWNYSSEGLEDCRIFFDSDRDWMTCATIGTHPGNIGQTLCRLSEEKDGPTLALDQFIPLKSPHDQRCEKNWLPFIKGTSLYMVYCYDPLTLFEIDRETGLYQTTVTDTPKMDLSRLRGSAAPIEWEDGYLAVVHEVVFDQKAFYMHRFLQLDRNFKIKSLSEPFFFKQKGVEYCSGMTYDHSGQKILLTIGVEDKEAYLVHFNLDLIKSMLEANSLND